MTFVSFADACRRLGIDAKTLHRWLAEAQLALQNHPSDGRKKGVSREHLQLLARLHQRSLAPLPQEPPAPVISQGPPLPAELLALPDQVCALQTQITVLQQQMADLTRLLQQQTPSAGPRLLWRSRAGRAGVHLRQRTRFLALVLLPKRPASRFMSSLAWSMARKGTLW